MIPENDHAGPGGQAGLTRLPETACGALASAAGDKPSGDDLIKPGRLMRARIFHARLPLIFAARQKKTRRKHADSSFAQAFGALTLLP